MSIRFTHLEPGLYSNDSRSELVEVMEVTTTDEEYIQVKYKWLRGYRDHEGETLTATGSPRQIWRLDPMAYTIEEWP